MIAKCKFSSPVISIIIGEKHSSRIRTAHLPTVRVTVANARCQYLWMGHVLKWTNFNRSPVMTTRCHYRGVGFVKRGVRYVWGVPICDLHVMLLTPPLPFQIMEKRHLWKHYLPGRHKLDVSLRTSFRSGWSRGIRSHSPSSIADWSAPQLGSSSGESRNRSWNACPCCARNTWTCNTGRIQIKYIAILLPPANEVWGKVICLQNCVSVHRGRGCLFLGVCLLPGVPAPGGYLVETAPRTATAAGGTHPTGNAYLFYFNFKFYMYDKTWKSKTCREWRINISIQLYVP